MTTETCPDCTTAKANPLCGGYHASCLGCRAAREAYRWLLAQVGVEHDDVLAWTSGGQS